MELRVREKKVPGWLWMDYIGAIVSDLVRHPVDRGRYCDMDFITRIHHQNVPNTKSIDCEYI